MPSSTSLRRSAAMDAQMDDLSKRIVEMISPCTNSQVARLIGVSDETVRRIRHGDLPSVRIVLGLCQVFDVSSEWLLFGRGEPPTVDLQSLIEPKARGSRARDLQASVSSR